MSNAFIRLGIAAVVISVLLAIGFAITGIPYAPPYSTRVWGVQIIGWIFIAASLLNP